MTEDFLLTVPQEICEAQNWKPGQSFVPIEKGSGVLLVPVPAGEEPSRVAGDGRDPDGRTKDKA